MGINAAMRQICKALLLFFSVMSSAWASGWEGNFLVGVESGYGWRDGQLTVNVTEAFPNTAQSGIAKDNYDNGFIWGIVAGYQVICHKLLFGGEINAGFQDIGQAKSFHAVDTTGDQYVVHVDHDRGTIYGFTLRTGYLLTPWLLPYIKAGFETSYEKLYLAAMNITQNGNFALDHERRVYRFVGGAGAELPIIFKLAFRLEYNWVSRGRGAHAYGVEPNSMETVNAELKAPQHSAKGVFVWNFD
jgi:opacity protein-like surface antigen